MKKIVQIIILCFFATNLHAQFTQQGSKLVGTGASGNANQGYSVALSAGGNTALVGGYSDNTNAGAAWVFYYTAPVLPIEWVSFTGAPSVSGNLLTWTIANEVNNKGFQVERRNGNNWATLGFIAANNRISAYQFTDVRRDAMHRVSTTATDYYRLRQIDNNGKETLSKVITIQSNMGKGSVKIYPSVTSGHLTLEGVKSFEIVNMMRQVVMSQTVIIHSTLTINHLQNGLYFIKGVNTEGSVFSEKIIKQ